jgi:2-phosphosulfolactate phosphatase
VKFLLDIKPDLIKNLKDIWGSLDEMKVKKTDFVEGATGAKGIVVIIDVFRAFSVACYCFQRGVDRIYPVGEIEEAVALSRQIPGSVLVGERYGKKLDGFDFGNSPTEIVAAELHAKVVVHTTHAGTQGLVNALSADELLTGAFVNAAATAQYIRERSPQVVTLVRMGLNGEISSDEDNLCADYLESLLLNNDFDSCKVREKLAKSSFSERFFDPAKPWSPASDFDLCLALNTFEFAIVAGLDEQGRLFLSKRK